MSELKEGIRLLSRTGHSAKEMGEKGYFLEVDLGHKPLNICLEIW